jgi:predicted Zn-dependent protease with MMP-like domain
MKPEVRKMFDRQLERVLRELPQQVRDFMEEVPLVVDDYPSLEIMRAARVRSRWALCGLYTGVPLSERSIRHSAVGPDVIHIFREGILQMARGNGAGLDADTLREQIRVTILHEYGHHVGLTEEDLGDLGYG